MGKILEKIGDTAEEIFKEIEKSNDENNDKGGFSYKGSLSVCVGDKMYAGSITIAGNNVSIFLN